MELNMCMCVITHFVAVNVYIMCPCIHALYTNVHADACTMLHICIPFVLM